MKIKDIFYISIILVLIGYCTYLHRNKSEPIVINNYDTLYLKKDSIITLIEETQNNLNNIDSAYKKDYIHITNQSVNDDIKFFSNYIDSTIIE
jgi:hypothetical protein